MTYQDNRPFNGQPLGISLAPRVRRFLAFYNGSIAPKITSEKPRIAVIGAGLAGLCAAHILVQSGLSSTVTVYDAASRVGGRVRTDRGRHESGLVSELGGEFIDGKHWDMLALAAYLNLPLIDTAAPSECSLSTAYYFEGRHFSEHEVTDAYSHFAPRIAEDIAQLSRRVSRVKHTDIDRHFDRMSIGEYLDALDMDRWLRRLIEVAYVAEYGLDAGEQSSINLLSLIGTDFSKGFKVFGDSDERYKVRDGNDKITEGLAQRLAPRVLLEHRMVRLRRRGQCYRLSLQAPSRVVEVDADAIILALPFTLLRQVDLGDTLPPHKQKVVCELGYGTNSKLMLGMHRRFWRDQHFDGGVYTDLPLQTGWDGSRLREGHHGVYTFFLGGEQGLTVGQGDVLKNARRLSALAERVFPGFGAQRTGTVLCQHWPSDPFVLGSYTCYRPGQWTTIAGDESCHVGHLYFAGEHCAIESQGYMNGAAESGRQAAQAILGRLR